MEIQYAAQVSALKKTKDALKTNKVKLKSLTDNLDTFRCEISLKSKNCEFIKGKH